MTLQPRPQLYNKDHLENQKPGSISVPLGSMEQSGHNHSPGDPTCISLSERQFSSYVLFYFSVTLMAASHGQS